MIETLDKESLDTMNSNFSHDVVEVGPGILVFKNLIPKDLNIINRISNILGTEDNPKHFNWMPAFVGYRQRMPEYRDCVDFRFKKTDIEHDQHEDSKKLQQIWQEVYDRQFPAVQQYSMMYNVAELRYWEAFNFIKYEIGQHFMEHTDHGFSYNCVTSLVTYLNDDYEGGELYFRMQNLTLKPEAGDVVIFPSNYMYPHQAMPVTKGTKHAIVTMLDYSDKYHKPEMYQETGS